MRQFFRGMLAWAIPCVGTAEAEESKLIITVFEKGTTQQLPCRIRVYKAGQSGNPVYLNVCDGSVEIPLAAGKYQVRVQRGVEYERQENIVETYDERSNENQTARGVIRTFSIVGARRRSIVDGRR
jgi:hypothetical protein